MTTIKIKRWGEVQPGDRFAASRREVVEIEPSGGPWLSVTYTHPTKGTQTVDRLWHERVEVLS